jgi:hypothetical protein
VIRVAEQLHPPCVRKQAKAETFHGIVHQPLTEKCEMKACANEPKAPRRLSRRILIQRDFIFRYNLRDTGSLR